MTNVDLIIKKHSLWSMGVGIIPIPIADFFAVTAIQLDMIHQLCVHYNVDYYESRGKAIISALAGATLARIGASIIKSIPFIGSVVGGVTSAILSGATTYATGQVIKRHFDSGGSIFNLNVDEFKDFYQEQFEKGKKIVNEWQEEFDFDKEKNSYQKPPESETEEEKNNSLSLDKLKELAKLKNAGMLTDEEYEVMKEKLFQEYLKKSK